MAKKTSWARRMREMYGGMASGRNDLMRGEMGGMTAT